MPAQLPWVILSPDFSIYPRTLIGHQAWQLGQWLEQQLSLPETIMLPQATLEYILKYNHQSQSMDWSIQPQTKIGTRQRPLKSLAWPTALKQNLIKNYHHFLGGGFVKVWRGDKPSRSSSNIIGEANLLQTIVDTWLDAINQRQPKRKDEPLNLFVSREIQADVSGIIFTRHPLAQHKFHYYIEAMPGVWSTSQINNRDTYQVDARTKTVIYHHLRLQNQALKRVADGLLPTKTGIKQKQWLVDDLTLKLLTQITHNLAIRQFKPLEIFWSIKDKRLFIDQIKTSKSIGLPLKSRNSGTQVQLPSKIFLELSSFNQISKLKQPVEQLIVNYRSHLLNFGFYPFTITRRKENKLLKLYLDRQWIKLNQFWQHHSQASLLFRLTDFNTNQLNQFSDAPQQKEMNGTLGLRGAAKILLDDRWLKFELETLELGWPKHLAINLILPFARSPLELTQLIRLIHQLAPKRLFHYWFEVATPAAILNLDQYPLRKLAGLIVDVGLLKTLVYGYDPENKYLKQIYGSEISAIDQLLDILANQVRKGTRDLKVILDSVDYPYDLISKIVHHSWSLTSSLQHLTELKFKIKQEMITQLT